MIAHAHAHGREFRLALDPRDSCYFDFAREGYPLHEVPASTQVTSLQAATPVVAVCSDGPLDPPPEASTAIGISATPECVPLALLAGHLPDPDRPFWWFSTSPLPDRRIPAGCPIQAATGDRLPSEADYWCHEGDAAWVKVDRTSRPKPPMKPRNKTARR